MTVKYCGGCNTEKSLDDFHKGATRCKMCMKVYKAQYFQKNKQRLLNEVRERRANDLEFAENEKRYAIEYRNTHKNESSIYQKRYQQENVEKLSEYIKAYNEDNKEKVVQNKKRYHQKKMNDISFRLEKSFVSLLGQMIRIGIPFKKENLNALPYTIYDLREYLENKFEFWMTWDNYGKYNRKTWNDNDTSTWTWNIDHIIPKSHFKYLSTKDESFQKCWSLNNLRPYSAKLNIVEGNRRKK
jgi:hypothetical protein